MRTYQDAEAMARALRAELRERRRLDLTHSECLEIVARQFGVDNWNILAALVSAQEKAAAGPTTAANGGGYRTTFAASTTIPVLRVFAADEAIGFYVDFLGFTLDFGGPAWGPGAPFYGQVSRPGATLQLTEQPYEPGAGATVDIWLTGLDEFRAGLAGSAGHVVPEIEVVHWNARLLVLADPFGNQLRLSEPTDPAAHEHLPRWAG